MRRAQQQTITFPAIDSTVGAGATKPGLTLLASDVQISKDGGAFASATNPPVELGSTGRYALTLTAEETNCSWIHVYVEKGGMRPLDITGALSDQPAAAVVADGGNSPDSFVTNLTSAANDFWAGAGIVFTSGALAGQVREIDSYDGTTKAITLVEPLTAAPAAGDLFVIING
jgi:hypothetical protein